MTYHFMIRAKERANLSPFSAEKLEKKAKEYGKSPYDFPTRERNYMQCKEMYGLNCLYYEGFFFLLREDGVCVTLYKAPGWFGKKKAYDGKTEVRNPKKYARLNREFQIME